MILVRSIYLKNFKQYRLIDIKPAPQPGLVFFIGKNKLGKSNFLNAICWCLYEEQPFKESIEQRDEATGLLNEDSKRENPYDEIRVEIEVQYQSDVFKFMRTQRPSQDALFNVYRKVGSEWKTMENPNTIVESFLPKDLRQYFIFAGENVQGLFTRGHEARLKRGVWQVANIQELDRGIEHLNIVYNELRKAASKGDVTLEDEEKKIEASRKSLDENTKAKKEKETEVEKLRENKREYEKKQAAYSKYSELINRRSELSVQIKSLEEDNEEAGKYINDLILTKAPFLFVEDLLKEVAEKLRHEKEFGTLPPKIKAEFIAELLERRECVCGRPLSGSDKEACAHLSHLKEEMEGINQRTPILEDQSSIRQIIGQLNEFCDELGFLRIEKAKRLDSVERASRALKDISVQLQGAPDVEVVDLESAIQGITNSIEELKEDIGRLKLSSENLQTEIATLEKSQKLAMGLKADALEKLERMRVIEETHDKLDHVRQKIVDRVRRSLSMKTEGYFKRLFWEGGSFEKIQFSEDYKLLVYKNGDDEPTNEFSTGELKTLGLAALKAIAELSGYQEVPIFFDAPLSNLDAQVRDNVLSMLPELAPQKQVFIFSLDDEAIMRFIKQREGGRYSTLEREPKHPRSTIIVSS